jgi:hypothetical protein
MTNQTHHGIGEVASPDCYALLSSAEFRGRLVQLQASGHESGGQLVPLVVARTDLREEGYPAFQLDARLNRSTFLKLRQRYKSRGISETYLWDFLRSVHKPLESMTGVDFLLGFYAPAVAVMADAEREEHFLDLAELDIWAILQ